VLWVVLVAAPPWFVHDRSLEGLKAQNAVRTTLLQGLGGVVLLVGAYFTYRQVSIGLEQLELARQQAQRSDERVRQQLQIAQQGQITERFTRAIDQLGHTQLDVRLGGIYALERIARDSSADRATIGEVLTAFVRSHAPWPPRLLGQDVAAAPLAEVPELQVRAADVQACLTVLGRGGPARAAQDQRDRLDLHAVDLRHANLEGAHLEWTSLEGAHLEGAYLLGAHLEWASLAGAHLEEANLVRAHLEWASLAGAHLEKAILWNAHLEEAKLGEAHLEEAILLDAHLEKANLLDAHLEKAKLGDAHLEKANLRGAHLEEAYLLDAHLEEASLGGAYLEGASLHGAHLEEASLAGAHLEGALADERTVWPEQFDWRAAGITVAGEDTAANGP
jgi:uncharacterized protein YjbI with pentapeptide repeats